MTRAVRLLREHLWLRLRLFRGGLRAGIQRGPLSALSAIVELLTLILLGLLVVGFAAALAWGAWLGGRILADPQERHHVVLGLRVASFALTVLMIAAPAVRASLGVGSGRARLLLLPIPRRWLHATEVAGALFNPWLLAAVPATLAVPLAAGLDAGVVAATIGLTSAVLYLFALTSVTTLVSATLQLLLRDRGRGEMISLAIMIGVVALGFLPVLLDARADDGSIGSLLGTPEESARIQEGLGRRFPWPLQLLPSEAHTAAVSRATAGRSLAAAASLLPLAAIGLLAYSLSWRAWQRLVDTPAASSFSVAARSIPARRPLPGVSPAAAEVAAIVFRTTMRTSRSKLALFVAPVMIVVLSATISEHVAYLLPAAFEGRTGGGLAIGGVLLALVELLPVLANQFASDGAGLARLLLLPIPTRQLIHGKLLGGGLLLALAIPLCVGVAALKNPSTSPWVWLGCALGSVSIYALAAPIGLLLSILFPRRADLGSLGSAGNAHAAAMTLGGLALLSATVPVALASLVARLLGGGPRVALAQLLWLAVSLAAATLMARALEPLLEARCQDLTRVAERG